MHIIAYIYIYTYPLSREKPVCHCGCSGYPAPVMKPVSHLTAGKPLLPGANDGYSWLKMMGWGPWQYTF